jgi:AcrR family transcriptional regulator
MKKTKRPYDATKRRERADEERRSTRRRVLAAAETLFVANGYSATTMADIASKASVTIQSVYKAGKSKAELLQRVIDVVVAGDDDGVKMTDRPGFAAIATETSAIRQVEMLAGLVAAVQERSAPVQVAYREAAAVDGTIAANLDAELQRRHETFAATIATIPENRLRQSLEESTDTAWAIGSSEVYLLLRIRRGWDQDHYEEWLKRTLVEQLLIP